MGKLALPGTEGVSVLGAGDYTLRQARAYHRARTLPSLNGTVSNISANLTGQISTSGSSKILTGAATDFTTELAKGDWIKTSAGNRQVESIQSDTALTLTEEVNIAVAESFQKYLTTLSGVGTTFTEEFKAGDYIQVGPETSATSICRVKSVTDDTTMDVIFGKIDASDVERRITADTGTVFRKFITIDLGDSDSISLKIDPELVDLGGQNEGKRAKGFFVDFDGMVTIEAVQLSLERLQAVWPGVVNEWDPATGKIARTTIGDPRGTDVSSKEDVLMIIGWLDGRESDDDLMVITCHRAAPTPTGEWKFDLESKQVKQLAFRLYADKSKLDTEGRAIIAEIGKAVA